MFNLTIEFDLYSQTSILKKLKKNGYDVSAHSFTLEKKSNFVPRLDDTVTYFTPVGHIELSGEVISVQFIIDEDGKESFYVLVDPTEK